MPRTEQNDLPLDIETEKKLRVDRDRLVAQLRARSEPEPTYTATAIAEVNEERPTGADTLVSLDARKRQADAAVVTDTLAPHVSAVEAMIAEGNAAIKRFERLKDKNLEHLSTIANLDLRHLLKVIPPVVARGADHASNHFYVVQTVNTARELFESANRWKPVDYSDQVAVSRGTLTSAANPLANVTGGDIANARGHLRHHLDNLLRMVAAFERGLGNLAAFEARVADDLAKVTGVTIEGEAPARGLPMLAPTPEPHGSSSFQEFDPREPSPAPARGPRVQRVGGEGEGVRIGDLGSTPRESKTVKLI